MKDKNIPPEIQAGLQQIQAFFLQHNFLGFSDDEQAAIEATDACRNIYALMEKYQGNADYCKCLDDILAQTHNHWSPTAAQDFSENPIVRDIPDNPDYILKDFDLGGESLLIGNLSSIAKLQRKSMSDIAYMKQYLQSKTQKTNKRIPAQKAFRLIAKKKANSKLGGLPNLPNNVEWPCNDDGEAMVFVAQIDLAEVPRLQNGVEYPENGAMLFFYDPEYYMNLEKSFGQTIYVPALSPEEHPAPETMNEAFLMEAEKRIGFKSITSKQTCPMNEEVNEIPLHQLFGYPSMIQDDDMREECVERCGGKVEDWTLLLQLDGDSELPMIWGDAGRAYYWIRKQDLTAGNFSSTCIIIQSC